MVLLYAGLTVGVEAASAIGVGVAKPPKGVSGTIYVGVRLDHEQLGHDELLGLVTDLDSSLVVDAQALKGHSDMLHRLAKRGVDVANGGWGERQATLLRWNRAKKDVDTTGQLIERQVGEAAHEFVPGRRLDGFDAYYSRREKQKLVVPDLTFRAGDKISLPRDREGLRARRARAHSRGDGTGDRAVPAAGRAGGTRRRAARGPALKLTAAKVAGVAGLAGVTVAVVHAAPALAGVSPVAVRVTPSLVGLGRRGHVALDVRRRPRSRVDARVPPRARHARVARDVLHAR